MISPALSASDQARARVVVKTMPDITQIESGRAKDFVRVAPDPDGVDPDLRDRKIEQICEELGVTFVTLRDCFGESDYKGRGVHPGGLA